MPFSLPPDKPEEGSLKGDQPVHSPAPVTVDEETTPAPAPLVPTPALTPQTQPSFREPVPPLDSTAPAEPLPEPPPPKRRGRPPGSKNKPGVCPNCTASSKCVAHCEFCKGGLACDSHTAQDRCLRCTKTRPCIAHRDSKQLKFALQKTDGYKNGKYFEVPALPFLQMADKHKRSFVSVLIIIIFLCVTQAKFGQLDYKRWNSTSYLSVGQNKSGIEWWKRGSMSPRLYSWQPNHGDRGKLYTKKPKPNPNFGSGNSSDPNFGSGNSSDPNFGFGNSNEISPSKGSLTFPPGFNKTIARNVAHTLKSAFHRALVTRLSAVSKAEEEPRSSKVAPLESRS